ncbi:hypothetical protein JHW43_000851 [Diplocarpon mali]|nr:hypothetical protein JHW43_000851 [Diplocarpon mali]
MALSSLDTGGAASRSPVMPGSVTTASSYTSADACDHLAPRSFALSPTMGWRGTVRKGVGLHLSRDRGRIACCHHNMPLRSGGPKCPCTGVQIPWAHHPSLHAFAGACETIPAVRSTAGTRVGSGGSGGNGRCSDPWQGLQLSLHLRLDLDLDYARV